MPKLIDLTGKIFGRLIVKQRIGTSSSRRPLWECECYCGNIKNVDSQLLLRGDTKSCGCLRKEETAQRFKTHGMRKTRIYQIWYAMKRRCLEETQINYKHYGGRGIRVCDRWMGFENFMEDMYQTYLQHVAQFGEKQTTLDRLDSDSDYTPENTRWATYSTQVRNTRVRIDNKTGHRGVFKLEENGRFVSYIKVNKKNIHLGTFDNISDAISKRKSAELTYWEK